MSESQYEKIASLFFLFSSLVLPAQTTQFSLGGVSVASGATAEIEVKVEDFTSILSFQFSIVWNPIEFEFVSVEAYNLPEFNQGSFNLAGTADGVITCLWWDSSLSGVTLSDETGLFQNKAESRLSGNAGLAAIQFGEEPTEIIVVQLSGTDILGDRSGDGGCGGRYFRPWPCPIFRSPTKWDRAPTGPSISPLRRYAAPTPSPGAMAPVATRIPPDWRQANTNARLPTPTDVFSPSGLLS
ncbi:MAG: hypothetical protein IPH04_14175 [Saprospirales bacterium]|nr:hypothetical protein [Saprospirales bacterium]